jgi:O-antigen/teichoic acid export membrane protein
MIQVRRPADLAEVEPAYESLKWLKISFPLVLVAGFKTLIARIDVIMLGIMTESSSVAVYHAASRVAVFLLLVQTAMSALSAPKIAKLFAQEKMDELQALVSGILNWVFWPTLLLAAVIVIMGHEILYMFGAGFVDGYPILLVLAVGQLVTASAGHVLQLLNMTGNQGHSARIFGWCALINILLNGALIPMYGAMGASIATAVTMLAWNLWMVTMVKRLTGINSLKLSVDRK